MSTTRRQFLKAILPASVAIPAIVAAQPAPREWIYGRIYGRSGALDCLEDMRAVNNTRRHTLCLINQLDPKMNGLYYLPENIS